MILKRKKAKKRGRVLWFTGIGILVLFSVARLNLEHHHLAKNLSSDSRSASAVALLTQNNKKSEEKQNKKDSSSSNSFVRGAEESSSIGIESTNENAGNTQPNNSNESNSERSSGANENTEKRRSSNKTNSISSNEEEKNNKNDSSLSNSFVRETEEEKEASSVDIDRTNENTGNMQPNSSSSSSSKIKSKSIDSNSKSGSRGACESLPFSEKSLPLGSSGTHIYDGHNRGCLGLNSMLWDSFALSFPQNASALPKLQKHRLSKEMSELDCSQFPPTTLMMMQQANDKRLPYSAIRQCTSQSNHPFITFRATPKESILGPSELSTKSGLAEHVRRYLPCHPKKHHNEDHIQNHNEDHIQNHNEDHIQNHSKDHDEFDENSCIMPQTFSISKNGTDCQRFFDLVSQHNNNNNNHNNSTHHDRRNVLWVKKPLKGSGGVGIELLQNPIQDLNKYAKYCQKDQYRNKLKQIVVQRYIPPKLILDDGRSFHIRVYFVFKYASLATAEPTVENATTKLKVVDPPQAWHIHVGNVHICSEPYRNINHETFGNFAMKCNRHAWDENARMKQNRTEQTGQETTQVNISFHYPYPQFLRQTLFRPDQQQEYNALMKRIDLVLGKTAQVIHAKAQETNTYALKNEAMWTVIGADLILDESLRPWLLETNICPGNPLYESRVLDKTRNPYLSIYRIVLSHYKRRLMNDDEYDENACDDEDDGNDDVRVSRVM